MNIQAYEQEQELRDKIINSLPNGFKKHLHDNLVHHYLNLMVRQGTFDVGMLLVAVLDNRQEIMDTFKKHIELETPRYIVASQETIDKMKAEQGAKFKGEQ